MKKWVLNLTIVLVIGFLLGGAVVAKNSGTPFMSSLFGTNQQDSIQAAVNQSTVTASAIAGPSGIADIVEKASPAVVNIESKVKVSSGYDPYFNDPFFRQFFGDRFRSLPQSTYETGIGTGFIISEDGYIITNQHVIDNAVSITVQLNGQKKGVPARVVGQDYELDLAVLKIDGNGYATLPMGDSDKMRVGDWVVAIGEPYGLDHTVTTGVISAKGRPITIDNRNYKNLIQTDAAINPGNSGGPLLNMSGQVIAINTAVNAEAQGIGFAIPINTAKGILQQLINNGKVTRPYMGVMMTDINEDIINRVNLPANTQGVVVVEVVANSPAAQAGLKNLDVITGIDGKAVTSATEVQTAVENKKVGDRIEVEVLRNGSKTTIPIVLQAKPQ
ncbi:MAG: trypsin-like peptidase domain-containing protein [Syntrophomonadaceae bacterium]|jgi:serine protease Do